MQNTNDTYLQNPLKSKILNVKEGEKARLNPLQLDSHLPCQNERHQENKERRRNHILFTAAWSRLDPHTAVRELKSIYGPHAANTCPILSNVWQPTGCQALAGSPELQAEMEKYQSTRRTFLNTGLI
ncbi:hypothetical protein Y1Q_0007773 [Alligator mississippiensis]|uniref:Uncharacterized protein n=1 Tax=Alligator mississippiensis TaxID=8496 RepID=A0A151N6U9_ALLMI|nr:hypothetical protein Y1Q_0007773 [Alligator mississippiensis]